MAKAKKADTTESKSAAPKKKAAAPALAAKKSAKPAASGGGGFPMVDTSLAAQAVAAMMANRAAMGGAAQQPKASEPAETQRTESSAFKQMKEGLGKPSTQKIEGLLGGVQGKKKSNQPFGGGNQVGHNQTFGADVNRSGVPRRTPG